MYLFYTWTIFNRLLIYLFIGWPVLPIYLFYLSTCFTCLLVKTVIPFIHYHCSLFLLIYLFYRLHLKIPAYGRPILLTAVTSSSVFSNPSTRWLLDSHTWVSGQTRTLVVVQWDRIYGVTSSMKNSSLSREWFLGFSFRPSSTASAFEALTWSNKEENVGEIYQVSTLFMLQRVRAGKGISQMGVGLLARIWGFCKQCKLKIKIKLNYPILTASPLGYEAGSQKFLIFA